ncbi:hypothetical protein BGZ97_010970 [Linnemannia gamsii]|uniref:Uncharacterized protein n=1 Tax=Linnemannia gamsii TaxID=64522 RepID=A0A9P6R931_9FUNG|nr:hypothetical protein BGZ97_010970 [Linnemannia gamsii]
MIQIRTSVQAKGTIIKNAAALEPVQDGNQYRYTIHTPLEDKLEKAVTFQVFVTIPRQLDSLESFTIEGANLDLAIGDISHTFIRCLTVNIGRGDTTIDGFYGELAKVNNTNQGGITGKYSVARLVAHARETTAALVAAAAAVAPEQQQRVLGNFINFGGATRIRMSRSFLGRLETRTHYGKIFIMDPEFTVIEGAVLTLPSASDRNAPTLRASTEPLSIHSGTATLPSANSYLSNILSSRSTTSSSWGQDDHHSSAPPLSPVSTHSQQYLHFKKGIYTSSTSNKPPSAAGSGGSSTHGSENNSRAESTTGSFNDGGSPGSSGGSSILNGISSNRAEKQRKREEEEWRFMTREVIGTYGSGVGLIMAKNSSGDITVELF